MIRVFIVELLELVFWVVIISTVFRFIRSVAAAFLGHPKPPPAEPPPQRSQKSERPKHPVEKYGDVRDAKFREVDHSPDDGAEKE